MTDFNRAVLLVGGQTAMANLLSEITGKKVSQFNIYYWLNSAKSGVPAQYCRAIEAITNGAVTAEELRPDIFGATPIQRTTGWQNGVGA